MMLTRRVALLAQKLPLRSVLIAPFVVQLFAAVSLTAWLSFRNGQKAINTLAGDLTQEITDRIDQHLHSYLETPHSIDRINAEAYKMGDLLLSDVQNNPARLMRRFWQQSLQSNGVGTIALATKDGYFVGANRSENYVAIANKTTGQSLRRYAGYSIDPSKKPLLEKPNYDPRQRPWYQTAVRVGQPTWTEISRSATSPRLDLSAVYPIYANGQLQGTFLVDVSLAQLGQFLQKLKIGHRGEAFILELDGKLVASSMPQLSAADTQVQQQDVLQKGESTLIHAVGVELQSRFGSLSQVTSPQAFLLQWQKEPQFVQVKPFRDRFGLNWLIVVVVPRSDFMAEIRANTKVTIVLCLVALGVAMIVGIGTAQLVIRPITRLSDAAEEIANSARQSNTGEFGHQVHVRSVREVVALARSFNQMADRLRQSFAALEQVNEDLEIRVQQRTTQLTEAEAEMRALFTAMTDFIFVKDKDGRYLKVASTDPNLVYRHETDWLVGQTEHQVLSQEMADRFVGYIHEALTQQQTIQVEYQLQFNEKQVWFTASISPISGGYSADGSPAVIWVARDITKRKKAEEELRQKEQYLRTIIDNIPQQVFWKNVDLVFEGCNKNWADAAGLASPDEAIGKTDYHLLPHHVAEEIRRADRQVIDTDTPLLHLVATKQKPGADGHIIWLDINKLPIHGADGQVIGVLGVLEDITERKLAQDALSYEKQKSENLLLNVLPHRIAEKLKQVQEKKIEDGAAIAEQFESATILFADIVGFTPLSAHLPAQELINLLNQIFSTFDLIAEKHGLEKIKTIGDAYMVAGGLPVPRPDHAEAIARMALDMQQAIVNFQRKIDQPLSIRIGINTGPVVAGVIGIKKFIYDLWGDTVNVASRMESSGIPGKVQVTRSTYDMLKHQFTLKERGEIEVKGKGKMMTYWLIEELS
jgi:PAS domain S-box-containing protein